MKKYAILSTILDIVAIAFFIVGMIVLSGEDTVAAGTACVSAGFVFLGVGIFFNRKTRNDKNGDAE